MKSTWISVRCGPCREIRFTLPWSLGFSYSPDGSEAGGKTYRFVTFLSDAMWLSKSFLVQRVSGQSLTFIHEGLQGASNMEFCANLNQKQNLLKKKKTAHLRVSQASTGRLKFQTLRDVMVDPPTPSNSLTLGDSSVLPLIIHDHLEVILCNFFSFPATYYKNFPLHHSLTNILFIQKLFGISDKFTTCLVYQEKIL